jgi:hypothetical protein
VCVYVECVRVRRECVRVRRCTHALGAFGLCVRVCACACVVHFTVDAANRHLTVRRNLRF